MLTRTENDLLTRTGPGTSGGELLRRYWQPVALSEELAPGSAPVPVNVLGEALTLFRDELGRVGLLGLHCSHRAADLSYGRVEDGGLRCLYHGWLYDVEGNCLDQPGEPVRPPVSRPDSQSGSSEVGIKSFKDKIKHPAYPCQEKAGVVFAYMGPGEPPLLPAYEFLELPDAHRIVTKVYHDCNYLQANEGNIDPQHLSVLHYFLREDPETIGKGVSAAVQGGTASSNALFGKDVSPTIEVEETDYGERIYAVRDADEQNDYVRITNFIYPNLASFPAFPGVYGVNWHVPTDDTHHWKFMFMIAPRFPIPREMIGPTLFDGLGADYRLARNSGNRYQQSRAEMTAQSFIGMGPSFAVHDKWATEGEGGIQDRTTEHLGYSDKAVILQRRLLLQAIRTTQDGGEPPHVLRDASANHFEHLGAYQEVVPKGVEWSSVWKKNISVAS